MILDLISNNYEKDESNFPIEDPEEGGDKWMRSFMKALSWRIIGTLDTIIIAFYFSDNLQIALSIGGVELFTKMFLYIGHERIWGKIKWGKNNKPQ